jgi:two-component system NarL family response regulator
MSAPALYTKLLRVYVVEPQALLGKALCRILSEEPHVAVVGESPHCDTQAIAQARPDVIVFDAENYMSNISDFVRRMRAVLPDVRICLLSSQLSASAMMRAISAGVDGYVIKDVTPAELASCIKKIGTDGFYADPRLAGELLRERAKGDGVRLSRREVDVARLVAEGLSNKQIASRLLVSDKTVKNHIANIFSKLEISARTQIAVYVVRNGIA